MDEITYRGYTIKLEIDEDPEDPREWSNLGIMVCRHSGYTLGDVQIPQNFYDEEKNEDIYIDTREDLLAWIKHEYGEVYCLKPLMVYEHSGITMSTTSFSGDPQGWDTSLSGYIFTTKKRILEAFGAKEITDELLKRVDQSLTAEVETYAQYLEGNVFGYVAELDGESVGSCWGYYDREQAIAEAKDEIDGDIDDRAEKAAKEAKKAQNAREIKLKAYIRNSVPLQYRHLG